MARRFVGMSEKGRESSMRSQSILPVGPSRGTSQVPQLRSPILGASKKVIRCGPSFLVMCSSAVHLTETQPHSPPTSPIGNTHATYGEADHALTCAYHLLSFPICPLDIALSHCFSACSDDPRLSFAAPASTHSSPVSLCQPPAIIFLLSKYQPLSDIICPRRTTGSSQSPSKLSACTTPATRNAAATPTQVTPRTPL